MKFGLTATQLQEIVDFIGQYTEVESAVIFGSRAQGNYKPSSDVDIALKGEELSHGLAAQMKHNLEENSILPFFVDFVCYDLLTDKDLKASIDVHGEIIYPATYYSLKSSL
ncbi:MAG: nucleotidyltransferase domain-containing protein [Fibrobacter sp.]|nr:nucleotidyltransferase domain-containing protein [Fibrobacter sp.]